MKRVISILMVTLLLMNTLYAGAYTVQFEDYAQKLKSIQVFKGTDNGFELDREPTRIEAAVLFVRLLGAEKEALSSTYEHPFTDVPSWADKYIGYLYEKELTNGIGNGLFGSDNKISAGSYFTFLLRALDYNDSLGDFSWNTALDKALEVGMIQQAEYSQLNSEVFLRDHVAKYSYKTLGTHKKSSDVTLIEFLINENAITLYSAVDMGLVEDKVVNLCEMAVLPFDFEKPIQFTLEGEEGYFGNSLFSKSFSNEANSVVFINSADDSPLELVGFNSVTANYGFDINKELITTFAVFYKAKDYVYDDLNAYIDGKGEINVVDFLNEIDANKDLESEEYESGVPKTSDLIEYVGYVIYYNFYFRTSDGRIEKVQFRKTT